MKPIIPAKDDYGNDPEAYKSGCAKLSPAEFVAIHKNGFDQGWHTCAEALDLHEYAQPASPPAPETATGEGDARAVAVRIVLEWARGTQEYIGGGMSNARREALIVAIASALRAKGEVKRERPACGEPFPEVPTEATAPIMRAGLAPGWLSAWPVRDVLLRLADAADHLLNDHSCDVHGHEVVSTARDAAREHARLMASPPPTDEPATAGGAKCSKCDRKLGELPGPLCPDCQSGEVPSAKKEQKLVGWAALARESQRNYEAAIKEAESRGAERGRSEAEKDFSGLVAHRNRLLGAHALSTFLGGELPEDPPEYAPDGYGLEVEWCAAVVLENDLDNDDTLSAAVKSICARLKDAEAKVSELSAWTGDDDQPLPEDDAIHAAFPTRSGSHAEYAEAMRLVVAKRSKGALVELVNWLLFERDALRTQADDAAVLLENERLQHDETRGYRQHAEQERDALSRKVETWSPIVARLILAQDNGELARFDKPLLGWVSALPEELRPASQGAKGDT